VSEPAGDVGTLPTVLQSGEHGAVGERLAAGQRAGDYVIDRYLGGGGMGDVYAGHHPVIGKKVAVKLIKSTLAASPEAVERLTREARAVNQVDHENVVDVFALGNLPDGRLYLVMDLVDGESLRARVARGALLPADALAVLERIAAALDAAHARGVVHRDLKPDNVMVSGTASRVAVKVLDFGIAKLVSTVATDDAKAVVATATLTGQGTWLGTPAYMAPEQWSADGASAASDRYALAAMAYELLTGAPPFVASTAPALMEKHFRAEVPTVGAGFPAGVDVALRTGMAKDPDARFASAIAFVTALRDAIGTSAGAATAATSSAPARDVIGSPPTGGRKLGTLPVVAGLAGLGVLAAGIWIVSRDRKGGGGRDVVEPRAGTAAQVMSTPPGATIVVDGVEAGVTPRAVEIAKDRRAELEVRKPGYLTQKRTLAAGEVADIALQPVDAFQGTWALKSGELRRFVRQGDAVVALRLAAASEAGTYYRRFQFVPSTGAIVSFAAEEEYVDPHAPDEPTCHVPLKAVYDYDLGGDELELRKERVRLELVNGKCVVADQGWAEPEVLARVDRGATAEGDWAESRAGGAAVDVPVAGDDTGNTGNTGNTGLEPPPPANGSKPPPDRKKPAASSATERKKKLEQKKLEQQKLEQKKELEQQRLDQQQKLDDEGVQQKTSAPPPPAQQAPMNQIAPPARTGGTSPDAEGAVQTPSTPPPGQNAPQQAPPRQKQ
jgi:tRNA A-37 threonylcarbamoyl transferase component Bud32